MNYFLYSSSYNFKRCIRKLKHTHRWDEKSEVWGQHIIQGIVQKPKFASRGREDLGHHIQHTKTNNFQMEKYSDFLCLQRKLLDLFDEDIKLDFGLIHERICFSVELSTIGMERWFYVSLSPVVFTTGSMIAIWI